MVVALVGRHLCHHGSLQPNNIWIRCLPDYHQPCLLSKRGPSAPQACHHRPSQRTAGESVLRRLSFSRTMLMPPLLLSAVHSVHLPSHRRQRPGWPTSASGPRRSHHRRSRGTPVGKGRRAPRYKGGGKRPRNVCEPRSTTERRRSADTLCLVRDNSASTTPLTRGARGAG